MADYALRSDILNAQQGILALSRRWSLLNYLREIGETIDYNEFETLEKEVSNFSLSPETIAIWKEAESINRAFYERTKRLKKTIRAMLYSTKPCFFITLTFDDVTLSSTSEKTRRVYVTRFLKSLSSWYVANIDYGKENGREHFHAVVVLEESQIVEDKLIKINPDLMSNWKYGFSHNSLIGERTVSSDHDVKIAKYMSKLSNHAIKDTARQHRAIYSKP